MIVTNEEYEEGAADAKYILSYYSMEYIDGPLDWNPDLGNAIHCRDEVFFGRWWKTTADYLYGQSFLDKLHTCHTNGYPWND